MIRYILLIISVVVFNSCDEKQKSSQFFKDVDSNMIAGKSMIMDIIKGDDIHIDYKKINKNSILKFSDIFESIKFVKLESNSKSMIGTVNKMYVKDDFFYILDTYKAKTLEKFNDSGKHVTTFGTHGPGPNELQEITDFFVDDHKTIIYDQFKGRLFHYSLDGQFLFSKKVPFILNSFFCYNDNEYVFHLFDCDNYHISDILNYSILKTDSNFVVDAKSSFREKDKYTNHISKNNIIFSNDKYYYHPPFNDTIFSINRDGSLNYDYIFNFGKNALPVELILKENYKQLSYAWRNEEYVMFIGDFVPTKNFVYTNFSFQGYSYQSFYSNRTRRILYGNLIDDDLSMVFSLSNILTSIGDDTLIGITNAYQITESLKRINKEELKKYFTQHDLELLTSINEEDNPILVFYKIKDSF